MGQACASSKERERQRGKNKGEKNERGCRDKNARKEWQQRRVKEVTGKEEIVERKEMRGRDGRREKEVKGEKKRRDSNK